MPKYSPSRLQFPHGEQRKFMETVFEKSGLNANNLAKIVGVSPRTIRDWKREKFNITEIAVNQFSDSFKITPPDKRNLINNWLKTKLEISRMGALARFDKYGDLGTPEGRKKGGMKTMRILRDKGIIPAVKKFKHPTLSRELAEFVGIMLGDGGITSLQIQITLNSIADKKYLLFVKNLCLNLFKVVPKTFKKKGCNANVIYYNGVDLITFLKHIGLKVGNKVKLQVDVPNWIKLNKGYSIACLRGLMDTDGCIAIHKYKVNKKEYTYKKLIFTNCSIPLAEFAYKTLVEAGFHPKMVKILEKRQVWLYNTNEARRYLDVIGSSNQRLNRFK